MEEPVVKPTGDARSQMVGLALDIAKRWHDIPAITGNQAAARRSLWEGTEERLSEWGYDLGDLKAEVVYALAQYLSEKVRPRATSIVDDRPREYEDMRRELEASGLLDEEKPQRAFEEARDAAIREASS